jgi:hypothetical protein
VNVTVAACPGKTLWLVSTNSIRAFPAEIQRVPLDQNRAFSAAEKPNSPHPLALLPARRKRPRCRAAEKRD